jgi:hypothetical protein
MQPSADWAVADRCFHWDWGWWELPSPCVGGKFTERERQIARQPVNTTCRLPLRNPLYRPFNKLGDIRQAARVNLTKLRQDLKQIPAKHLLQKLLPGHLTLQRLDWDDKLRSAEIGG